MLSLRRFIEKLVRGKSIVRRLPKEFGRHPIYMSPDAALSQLKPGQGAFDHVLLDAADLLVNEDSVVWDIGANVGVFTLAAASIVAGGSVLAVEADSWLAGQLARSIGHKENQDLPINLLSVAVSDSDGVSEFMIAERGRAANSLSDAGGSSQMGGVRQVVHVPTMKLDSLLEHFEAPSLIKIDVEGAEMMAIRGAVRLLEEIRPTIFIEVRKELQEEMAEHLKDLGYLLFDPSAANGPNSIDVCVFNTLAIASEKFDSEAYWDVSK